MPSRTTRSPSRLADAEQLWETQAYPLAEYMDDLRRALWTSSVNDPNRRTMQRVYIERLGAIVNPPAPPSPTAAGSGGGGGFQQPIGPFLAAPNIPRSDLPAVARSQLRAIRTQARAAAAAPGASAMAKAHWSDIVDRVDTILDLQ